MSRAEILRVWGKADSFDLEFTHKGGTKWVCSVPPDTVDGHYAVEVWAINALGQTAHWTGELFMCNGVCHVELFSLPYQIWLTCSSPSVSFDRKTEVILTGFKSHYNVELEKLTDVILRKGCMHFEL